MEVVKLKRTWVNIALKKKRIEYWEKYSLIPSESYLLDLVKEEYEAL